MSTTNPVNLQTIPPPDNRAVDLALRREIMSDLNCCRPGTIQSYDKAKQSATISINQQAQAGSGTLNYPLLTDVPCFVLGGGRSYMSFPITSGDPCVIFFADRNIDTWWATGTTGAPPPTPRLHSLSDGMALVGLRSLQQALSELSSTAAELVNGSSGITVDTLIGIYNAATSMKAVNDQLAAVLEAWVNTGGSTPNPATVTAIQNWKALSDSLFS